MGNKRRVGVLPISHAEAVSEIMDAIAYTGMEPKALQWDEATVAELSALDAYVIIGDDTVDSTACESLVAVLHPLVLELKQQTQQGKPLLGIAQGANLLINSGLVPGLESEKVGMAIVTVCGDVEMRAGQSTESLIPACMRLTPQYQRNAFTRYLTPKDILTLSFSQQSRSFVVSKALYAELQEQGQLLFQYCDTNGNHHLDQPFSQSDSVLDLVPQVAAVSNKAGNVLAVIPSVEMATSGEVIFSSMREYIENNLYRAVPPLHYYPRRSVLQRYQQPLGARVCLVELLSENEKLKQLQNVMQQHGIAAEVRCYLHWEMQGVSEAEWLKLLKSGLLGRPDKENVKEALMADQNTGAILVRQKLEQYDHLKFGTLKPSVSLPDKTELRQGLVWEFEFQPSVDVTRMLEKIFILQVIAQPVVHTCLRYL
jgi:phosphoribosylformylglycinamidine synthase